MFSPTWFASQTSAPVSLSTAMIAGADGEGRFTWLSSWPFEVFTKMRFPWTTGFEFDMLWGKEPSSSIMSSRQMTSPSVGDWRTSSVTGPSLPLAMPWTSRASSSPRFVT
jgi:hypothetical protein